MITSEEMMRDFHENPKCGFCGKHGDKDGQPLRPHGGRQPQVPIDFYYHSACYEKWKIDIKSDPLYGKIPMYAPVDDSGLTTEGEVVQ